MYSAYIQFSYICKDEMVKPIKKKLAEVLNVHFTKEDIQISVQLMKSTPFIY